MLVPLVWFYFGQSVNERVHAHAMRYLMVVVGVLGVDLRRLPAVCSAIPPSRRYLD